MSHYNKNEMEVIKEKYKSQDFVHAEKVSAISEEIMKQMKFEKNEQDYVRIGAILHDIGKKKCDNEKIDMKYHPVIGAHLVVTNKKIRKLISNRFSEPDAIVRIFAMILCHKNDDFDILFGNKKIYIVRAADKIAKLYKQDVKSDSTTKIKKKLSQIPDKDIREAAIKVWEKHLDKVFRRDNKNYIGLL